MTKLTNIRNVDKKTGFKTRNILCQPVRGNRGGGPIAGVVQMMNKRNGDFDETDEETLSKCVQHVADLLSERFQELTYLAEKFTGKDLLVDHHISSNCYYCYFIVHVIYHADYTNSCFLSQGMPSLLGARTVSTPHLPLRNSPSPPPPGSSVPREEVASLIKYHSMYKHIYLFSSMQNYSNIDAQGYSHVLNLPTYLPTMCLCANKYVCIYLTLAKAYSNICVEVALRSMSYKHTVHTHYY